MIPKIVHRSVPRQTTDLMDKCWTSVLKNTPDWKHMTHYDTDSYDYVGPYLDMCGKGAFRADLIRLEVIYKYGGVYLDSDVRLFKSIDPLLNHKVFVPLENDKYVMNAIIGAEPENKYILDMLEKSIEIVKSGKLLSDNIFFYDDKSDHVYVPFGPYIAHNGSFDIDEITKLPSKDFMTFWGNKRFMKDAKLKYIKDPDVYGQHVYAGSWL